MDDRFDDLIDSARAKLQAGELMSKDEANAYMASSLFNPTNQVYFRAGLIACREYMARFVETQSPEIAASIRANWWPAKLGEDLGPPRLLRWDELTEGEYGEAGFKVKEAVSPTLEALPVAHLFLQTANDPPSDTVFRMAAGVQPFRRRTRMNCPSIEPGTDICSRGCRGFQCRSTTRCIVIPMRDGNAREQALIAFLRQYAFPFKVMNVEDGVRASSAEKGST